MSQRLSIHIMTEPDAFPLAGKGHSKLPISRSSFTRTMFRCRAMRVLHSSTVIFVMKSLLWATLIRMVITWSVAGILRLCQQFIAMIVWCYAQADWEAALIPIDSFDWSSYTVFKIKWCQLMKHVTSLNASIIQVLLLKLLHWSGSDFDPFWPWRIAWRARMWRRHSLTNSDASKWVTGPHSSYLRKTMLKNRLTAVTVCIASYTCFAVY